MEIKLYDIAHRRQRITAANECDRSLLKSPCIWQSSAHDSGIFVTMH